MKAVLRPLSIALLSLSLFAGVGRAQVIGLNFTGSDNSGSGVTPADGNGTIGPNDYVEFINGSFSVYDKTTGESRLQLADSTFWSSYGINFGPNDGVSDPRVIFDPTSQRWFASQVTYNAGVTDPSMQSDYYLIGVSDTSDPADTWHAFRVLSDPKSGKFADFPTLGVDSNAVYISGDMYHGATNDLGPSLMMFIKTNLLNDTVTNRVFFQTTTNGSRGIVMQPASCFDGSGVGNILAVGDVYGDSKLVLSPVLSPGTTNATFDTAVNITVPAFTAPLDAIQPDGSQSVALNDSRLAARVVTVNGIIFATHHVDVGGRSAIRWYRINASTKTLAESGTISDTNLDLYYPSIAANSNGYVVIGCNGSGSGAGEFIGSYACIGFTTNNVTKFGSPMLLAIGDHCYHDVNDQTSFFLDDVWGESRWGDYSATSSDPSDANRFWTIQMLPLYDQNADLTGGAAAYWKMQITEIQTVPDLSIAKTGSSINVSWPIWAPNYQLQSRTNLITGTTWATITSGLVTNTTTISYSAALGTGQKFFRLQKN